MKKLASTAVLLFSFASPSGLACLGDESVLVQAERLLEAKMGYVFVAPEGFAQDSDLEFWVSACLAFNSTLPEK